MTIEEAKELLDNLIGMISDNQESDYDAALNMAIKALKQESSEDCISRKAVLDTLDTADKFLDEDRTVERYKAILKEAYEVLPSVNQQKYEYHIDHTDCIWYGSDSGCPVTCSQYRDGWNDAMDYIFKNGKGYQPYRRDR